MISWLLKLTEPKHFSNSMLTKDDKMGKDQ